MGLLEQNKKTIVDKESLTKPVSSRVTTKEYENFLETCKDNGFSMAEGIRFLIRNELKTLEIDVDSNYQFVTSPWKIKGQLPCPLCNTWLRASNFARHAKNTHEGETTESMFTKFKLEADAMVKIRNGEWEEEEEY